MAIPWLPIAMVGSSLLSGFLGSQSQKSAQAQQQRQYQDYLKLLERISSPEFRYTPQQRAAQQGLFPLYSAMTAQAVGAPTTFPQFEEWVKGYDTTPEKPDVSNFGKIFSQIKNTIPTEPGGPLSPPTDPGKLATFKGVTGGGTTLADLTGATQRDQERMAELRRQYGEEKASYQQGIDLYESMRTAQEQALATQQGAQQSAIDVGLRNAVQTLLEKNRTLMGGGTSGHVAGDITQLGESTIPLRSQLQAAYNQTLRDWQSSMAQQGLAGLTNIAFNQPVGSLPYSPPTPPPAIADQSWANLAGDLGGLATRYAWSRAMPQATTTPPAGYPGTDYRRQYAGGGYYG